MKAKKALNTEIKLTSRTTKFFHTIKRSNWSSTPVITEKKRKIIESVWNWDKKKQILNDIELKHKIRLNCRLEIHQPESKYIFSTIAIMVWNKEAFISKRNGFFFGSWLHLIYLLKASHNVNSTDYFFK